MHRAARRRGFTVVELLLTMSVVSILAAALIPNVLTYQRRPFDTETLLCLKAIITAQVSCHAGYQHYASSVPQFGDPQITTRCQDVQLSSTPPAAVSASGDGTWAATPDDYQLFAWSRRGNDRYQYRYGLHQPPTRLP